MTSDKLITVIEKLVDQGVLPPESLEPAEDETLESTIKQDVVSDSGDNWLEVYSDNGKSTFLVFLSEEGINEYVKDEVLIDMDRQDLATLLEKVSGGWPAFMNERGWGLSESGDFWVSEKVTHASKSKLATVLSRAASGGIGNYSRGDVITSVHDVQKRQLIIHDSITFDTVNLGEVTRVLDDSFYVIYVNPDDPTKKRKKSDEEFPVYAQQLERGEYYVALEPVGDYSEEQEDNGDTKEKTVEKTVEVDTDNDNKEELEVEKTVETEVPKTSVLESPVREHSDYGETPHSAEERQETQGDVLRRLMTKQNSLDALGYGESPEVAMDVPDANPITVDDPYHESEEDLPTTFASYTEKTLLADYDDEDESASEDTSQKLLTEYEFIPITAEEDEFAPVDYDDEIIIDSDFTTAYHAGREIARGETESELAQEVLAWQNSKGYWPGIFQEQERGDVQQYMIKKAGALDNFEIQGSPERADYSGITGSASLADQVLASLPDLGSAPGGLGDDGSAYNLDTGRNFSGVDEEEVAVVASEYLDGKAVSFATLEDFMGFVGDVYGVVGEASPEIRQAWHADDVKTLSSLIAKQATKNELELL